MKEKKDKKPFRETKFGSWVKNKFPDVLDKVGDLTGIEALNVVSTLIDGKPNVSVEDQREMLRLKFEMETELYRLEVEDRNSARERETEFAKATGKADWMQRLVGIIGLALLTLVIVYALFADIKNPNEFAHVKGLAEGIGLAIFTYFYGTSGGSKQKQAIIERLTKK